MIHKIYLAILAFVSMSVSCFSSDRTCETPVNIPSVVAAINKEKLIFLGELHGSNEMPAFLVSLACYYVQSGERVLIALEMPDDQNNALASFLKSPSDDIANIALSSLRMNKFWSRKGDGRQSRAMLTAINNFRGISQKYSLDLIGVDLPIDDYNNEKIAITRDQYMAKNIESYMQTNRYDRIIFYAGNNHTRLTKRKNIDSPVAYYMKKSKPFSIVLSFKIGELWACTNKCGIHKFEYNKNNSAPENVFVHRDANDFDGIVYFKLVTASQPALKKSEK